MMLTTIKHTYTLTHFILCERHSCLGYVWDRKSYKRMKHIIVEVDRGVQGPLTFGRLLQTATKKYQK
jgi:hypothetical protein